MEIVLCPELGMSAHKHDLREFGVITICQSHLNEESMWKRIERENHPIVEPEVIFPAVAMFVPLINNAAAVFFLTYRIVS